MPPEIRQAIYRNLLFTKKPILVYGKWTKIFARHKPALSITILMVCRLFYEEALPILYGENTFLYRLRDPPALYAELYDVNQLPLNDTEIGVIPEEEGLDYSDEDDEEVNEHENGNSSNGNSNDGTDSNDDNDNDEDAEFEEPESDEDNDDDDDSEYEEVARRARNRRTRKPPKPDIDIDKFKFLIRNITVEAESNRCSQKFKSIMAQALQVFAFKPSPTPQVRRNPRGRPPKKAPDLPSNVYNLTVRVAPTYTNGRWTFLDFFDSKSPVLQAALAAQPHFLRVELARRRTFATTAKDGDSYGTRLVGDMRPYRATRRAQACVPDDWGADRAMLVERRKRTRRCELGVLELRERVLTGCRRRWLVSNDNTTEEEAHESPGGFWSGADWDESANPDDAV
jgi:hypothetical protein